MIKRTLGIMVTLLFLASSIPTQATVTAAPPTQAPLTVVAPIPPATNDKMAPVLIDGKTLFQIRVHLYSFTPAERAAAISQRLTKLSEQKLGALPALTVVEYESTTEIFAGEQVLMTITEADAVAAGSSRQVLAQEYQQTMRTALIEHVRTFSAHSLLVGLLYSGGASLALIVLLIGMKISFRKLLGKVTSWEGTWIRSLRVQSIEILQQEQIVVLLVGALKILRTLLVLVLLYTYLSFVFSFFPWTRGVADKLFGYIYAPVSILVHGLIAYIPHIFFIAVIIVVTHYFLRFIKIFFTEMEKGTLKLPGFHAEWAVPTFNIARFLVIAFAVVVAFPYLPGADSPAFKGVSVFLGVLLSLGSSSAVGNIVAGVIITYMRPFKVGERVKIADTVGDVVEKTLLVTRVRTIKNVDITIPNAMVLSSHITNYSSSTQDHGLILHTTVTIGYDVPWRQVHELLTAAAKASEHILELPAPFVLQTSLDDFYVSYELNAYTNKPSAMAVIYSQLHQNIQDKFNEGGVEIMSPHFGQLRDGNATTIPATYLPADYVPPGFRLNSSAHHLDPK